MLAGLSGKSLNFYKGESFAKLIYRGVAQSGLAHLAGGERVAGSNPAVPTNSFYLSGCSSVCSEHCVRGTGAVG